MESIEAELIRWYVMRDLKRSNAKSPAYKVLETEYNLEVFTPMQWKIIDKKGEKVREYVPFLSDLLFVHASRQTLDPIISAIPTLQYRYVRGGKYQEGMVVRDEDMERFINAVNSSTKTEYFMPAEITPNKIGSKVKIIGGPLDGYVGNLLSMTGTRNRRLLVNIPNLLTAAVEVNPEYIQKVVGRSYISHASHEILQGTGAF